MEFCIISINKSLKPDKYIISIATVNTTVNTTISSKNKDENVVLDSK